MINTIRTASGHYFDFNAPDPGTIEVPDIAAGLGRTCRFGGQIKRFYSVAEHSLLGYHYAKQEALSTHDCLAVLLHDAAEAYTGDVVKPLKIMLPDFAAVEERVERAIELRFTVNFASAKDVIKEIDLALVMAEKRAMFSADNVKWYEEDQALIVPFTFLYLAPDEAMRAFETAVDLAHSAHVTELQRQLQQQIKDRARQTNQQPA